MQRIYKCVYWLMFKFGITRDWWFTKKEIQDACVLQKSKVFIPIESGCNCQSFVEIKKVYKSDN